MTGRKNEILDRLLKSYEAYFNIERQPWGEGSLLEAKAIFHSRSEKYVLVKTAKLWAVETNEIVYIINGEINNIDDFKKIRNEIIEDGLKDIKPNSEHMYTYITMVYIGENIAEEIKKEIKTFEKHKTFLFSIHGWMDFRMAAVDINKNDFITNKKGRGLCELLSQII